MSSVLFGSIGTLADTSELQRQSFNEAFRAHGLDWDWSQADYQEMLRDSGGQNRIARYAESRSDDVDSAALHATKTRLYREKLAAGGIAPRPGVAETIEEARREGLKIALVTTTSHGNVTALTEALRPAVDIASFDLVVDAGSVDRAKPSPDAYRFALQRLEEEPAQCVAVEDNVGGVRSATDAGLACVAFPGVNNADHSFDRAQDRVESLSLERLQALIAHA